MSGNGQLGRRAMCLGDIQASQQDSAFVTIDSRLKDGTTIIGNVVGMAYKGPKEPLKLTGWEGGSVI